MKLCMHNEQVSTYVDLDQRSFDYDLDPIFGDPFYRGDLKMI